MELIVRDYVEVAPYWNVNLGTFDKTNYNPTCRSSSILECK